MKGNDPPHDYLQKPSRRRLLSLSAGALATGLAGCSELGITGGGSSGLSPPDQTALEAYTDSYETTQQAEENYESGLETFYQNLSSEDDSAQIEGNYASDWPELREQMIEANTLFKRAQDGFHQARRSASSSTIESTCEEVVNWIAPHIEVAGWFGQSGGPDKEVVDEAEQEISELAPPPTPEELRNEI